MLESQDLSQSLMLVFEEPQGSESLGARLRSACDNLEGGGMLASPLGQSYSEQP